MMLKPDKKIIRNLEAIFFDFDGVLAESLKVKTEAFEQLFSQYGEHITEKVVDYHLKNAGISRYTKIEYYYKEYLKKPITEEMVNKIANDFSNIVVDKVIKSNWVKGAKTFLEKLYKRMDLYIISGTPQNELQTIVDKRQMKKFFKGVYGTPKTKAELINMLIKENNYKKNKVLFIGDALSDLEAALETEIPFLGRVKENTKNLFPKSLKIISNFNDKFLLNI